MASKKGAARKRPAGAKPKAKKAQSKSRQSSDSPPKAKPTLNHPGTFVDAGFHTSVAHVRFAAKRLREAALSTIPDLDEVAPPADWPEWPQDDATPWREWEKTALARVAEAVAWREHLTRRIGNIEHRNQCAPDSDWPAKRLAEELDCVLVQSNPGNEGNPSGDPDWGPPESVLGEFVAGAPDGTMERRDYVPGSHPAMHLGNARVFLGPPPFHLTHPPHYARLTGKMDSDYKTGKRFGLSPYNWPEFSTMVVTQCLLERARALELCQWCDDRIRAWESIYFPAIDIGPEIVKVDNKGKPGATARHNVTVTIAGKHAPGFPKTIVSHLVRDLRRIHDAQGQPVELDNADGQAGKLRAAIPMLAGMLLREGDFHYRLHPGMIGRITFP